MATNVNRTELVGFLGNDPDTRTAASGSPVTSASIAVHSYFGQGEQRKERTDWFRLVAFGEAAERLAAFRKGERITVTGRLQSSEYTDRDGIKRTSVELVVFRSEPAPLPRKHEAAEIAPVVETVAEPEPPAEPVETAPKTRKPRAKRAE